MNTQSLNRLGTLALAGVILLASQTAFPQEDVDARDREVVSAAINIRDVDLSTVQGARWVVSQNRVDGQGDMLRRHSPSRRRPMVFGSNRRCAPLLRRFGERQLGASPRHDRRRHRAARGSGSIRDSRGFAIEECLLGLAR